jgi:acetyl-CoA acetyltransferase
MDGAWALYEAWVRLQHGDIDSALVYAFGKSSLGDLRRVMTLQLDPYYTAPLWPDSISLAALQARALLESDNESERDLSEHDLAEVAVRSRANAKNNANAQVSGDFDTGDLIAEPYVVSPLRRHDCAPISDGAAAIVLAADDFARSVCSRPAWIRGIDHRAEPQALGLRDFTRSPSTALAAEKAGAANGPIDVAELHAPFTHQEIIMRRALRLNGNTSINPSGGALAANPLMVAGLVRIGEAAQRIIDGSANRVLAHATSGPCLQQNLVCVMEAA